jgi:Fur family ferric uptake transcriptional regulator
VRQTRQRAAIRQALLDAGRPLSHEEVLAAAKRRCPGLGIATVYRNVRRLREQGWLRAVELPGGPCRYEVADKAHHHHFHCVACDRIYEVEDCPGDLKRLAPRGFLVQRHEIILYGLCRTCR